MTLRHACSGMSYHEFIGKPHHHISLNSGDRFYGDLANNVVCDVKIHDFTHEGDGIGQIGRLYFYIFLSMIDLLGASFEMRQHHRGSVIYPLWQHQGNYKKNSTLIFEFFIRKIFFRVRPFLN